MTLLFYLVPAAALIALLFAWIFFRANDFEQAIGVVQLMFTGWNPWVVFDGSLFKLGLNEAEFLVLVFGIFAIVGADLIRRFKGKQIDEFLMGQSLWFRWAVLVLLIVSIGVFGVYGPAFDPQAFIYFQF